MVLLLAVMVSVLGNIGAEPHLAANVIKTQSGLVRGLLIERPHLVAVEAYFGLQYASVLNGVLRFMPPTAPTDKWNGIRMLLKFRPVCPQKLPNIADLDDRFPRSRVHHYERLLPFLEDVPLQVRHSLSLHHNKHLPSHSRFVIHSHYITTNIYRPTPGSSFTLITSQQTSTVPLQVRHSLSLHHNKHLPSHSRFVIHSHYITTNIYRPTPGSSFTLITSQQTSTVPLQVRHSLSLHHNKHLPSHSRFVIHSHYITTNIYRPTPGSSFTVITSQQTSTVPLQVRHSLSLHHHKHLPSHSRFVIHSHYITTNIYRPTPGSSFTLITSQQTSTVPLQVRHSLSLHHNKHLPSHSRFVIHSHYITTNIYRPTPGSSFTVITSQQTSTVPLQVRHSLSLHHNKHLPSHSRFVIHSHYITTNIYRPTPGSSFTLITSQQTSTVPLQVRHSLSLHHNKHLPSHSRFVIHCHYITTNIYRPTPGSSFTLITSQQTSTVPLQVRHSLSLHHNKHLPSHSRFVIHSHYITTNIYPPTPGSSFTVITSQQTSTVPLQVRHSLSLHHNKHLPSHSRFVIHCHYITTNIYRPTPGSSFTVITSQQTSTVPLQVRHSLSLHHNKHLPSHSRFVIHSHYITTNIYRPTPGSSFTVITSPQTSTVPLQVRHSLSLHHNKHLPSHARFVIHCHYITTNIYRPTPGSSFTLITSQQTSTVPLQVRHSLSLHHNKHLPSHSRFVIHSHYITTNIYPPTPGSSFTLITSQQTSTLPLQVRHSLSLHHNKHLPPTPGSSFTLITSQQTSTLPLQVRHSLSLHHNKHLPSHSRFVIHSHYITTNIYRPTPGSSFTVITSQQTSTVPLQVRHSLSLHHNKHLPSHSRFVIHCHYITTNIYRPTPGSSFTLITSQQTSTLPLPGSSFTLITSQQTSTVPLQVRHSLSLHHNKHLPSHSRFVIHSHYITTNIYRPTPGSSFTLITSQQTSTVPLQVRIHSHYITTNIYPPTPGSSFTVITSQQTSTVPLQVRHSLSLHHNKHLPSHSRFVIHSHYITKNIYRPTPGSSFTVITSQQTSTLPLQVRHSLSLHHNKHLPSHSRFVIHSHYITTNIYRPTPGSYSLSLHHNKHPPSHSRFVIHSHYITTNIYPPTPGSSFTLITSQQTSTVPLQVRHSLSLHHNKHLPSHSRFVIHCHYITTNIYRPTPGSSFTLITSQQTSTVPLQVRHSLSLHHNKHLPSHSRFVFTLITSQQTSTVPLQVRHSLSLHHNKHLPSHSRFVFTLITSQQTSTVPLQVRHSLSLHHNKHLPSHSRFVIHCHYITTNIYRPTPGSSFTVITSQQTSTVPLQVRHSLSLHHNKHLPSHARFVIHCHYITTNIYRPTPGSSFTVITSQQTSTVPLQVRHSLSLHHNKHLPSHSRFVIHCHYITTNIYRPTPGSSFTVITSQQTSTVPLQVRHSLSLHHNKHLPSHSRFVIHCHYITTNIYRPTPGSSFTVITSQQTSTVPLQVRIHSHYITTNIYRPTPGSSFTVITSQQTSTVPLQVRHSLSLHHNKHLPSHSRFVIHSHYITTNIYRPTPGSSFTLITSQQTSTVPLQVRHSLSLHHNKHLPSHSRFVIHSHYITTNIYRPTPGSSFTLITSQQTSTVPLQVRHSLSLHHNKHLPSHSRFVIHSHYITTNIYRPTPGSSFTLITSQQTSTVPLQVRHSLSLHHNKHLPSHARFVIHSHYITTNIYRPTPGSSFTLITSQQTSTVPRQVRHSLSLHHNKHLPSHSRFVIHSHYITTNIYRPTPGSSFTLITSQQTSTVPLQVRHSLSLHHNKHLPSHSRFVIHCHYITTNIYRPTPGSSFTLITSQQTSTVPLQVRHSLSLHHNKHLPLLPSLQVRHSLSLHHNKHLPSHSRFVIHSHFSHLICLHYYTPGLLHTSTSKVASHLCLSLLHVPVLSPMSITLHSHYNTKTNSFKSEFAV